MSPEQLLRKVASAISVSYALLRKRTQQPHQNLLEQLHASLALGFANAIISMHRSMQPVA